MVWGVGFGGVIGLFAVLVCVEACILGSEVRVGLRGWSWEGDFDGGDFGMNFEG